MKRSKQKLSIGSLTGISVRTRVRLATITELVRNGKVIAKGVATLHPGEEETMDYKTGERLSKLRAVDDFFALARAIKNHQTIIATMPPLSWFEESYIQSKFIQDEQQAKRDILDL